MRVKKFVPADQILGVEMVADSTTCNMDAETLAKRLMYYGAHHAVVQGDKVLAYFETSGDAECTWKHPAIAKCFKYKLNKGIRMIDKVPNWKKWYNSVHERDIERMEREERERKRINCEWDDHSSKKYSRSVETIYDRVVPIHLHNLGDMFN